MGNPTDPGTTRGDPIAPGIRFGVAPMQPDDIAAFGLACEELGADLITVGEGATEFRDPFMLLSDLAASTNRSRLSIAVTTPRLRHPAVLANSYATLHERSGGRAIIGLGSGDLGLVQLGEPPARLAELEEYARTVRTLAAGGEILAGDRSIRIRWANTSVPLWLAADGPRMLELAGRIADGVIVGQAGHPDIVRTVEARVARAAMDAGRSPDEIEIWYMFRALVTDDDRGAIALDGFDEYGARQAHFLWRVCGSLHDARSAMESIQERKGLALDPDIAKRLVDYCHEYSVERAFGTKTNVDLLERHGLTEWAGELFYVSGSETKVAERLDDLIAAGGRNFLVPARSEPTLGARLAWIDPVASVIRSRAFDSLGKDQPTV